MIEPENTSFYNAGDEVAAAKAAALYINGQGGINGRPVEIDYCNSSNDPNKTLQCARQMISDKVVAVSPSISITGPDMVTALAKAGIPVINENALYTQEFTSETSFPFSGGVPLGTVAEVAAAAKAGKHKVYMVGNDNPFLSTFIAGAKAACTKLGLEFVGDETLPQTAIADYAPFAQKIRDSGADVVLIPLSITQAVPLIQATRSLGSDVAFAINDGAFTNATLKSSGSVTNGLLIAYSAPPYTDQTAQQFPILKDFAQSIQQEAAKGDKEANLDTGRSSYMVRDWISLVGTFKVMKSISGEITASSLLAALNGTKDFDTQGIWPSFSLANRINIPGIGPTRVSESYWYNVVVQNGEFVLQSSTPFDATKIIS